MKTALALLIAFTFVAWPSFARASTDQLDQIQASQTEIIKRLDEIKEELRVIKVRISLG